MPAKPWASWNASIAQHKVRCWLLYFIQHYQPNLLGNQLCIQTMFLSSGSGTTNSLRGSWPDGLKIQLSIEHRRRRKHKNTDALSRLPCQQCRKESRYKSNSTIIISTAEWMSNHTYQDEPGKVGLQKWMNSKFGRLVNNAINHPNMDDIGLLLPA